MGNFYFYEIDLINNKYEILRKFHSFFMTEITDIDIFSS